MILFNFGFKLTPKTDEIRSYFVQCSTQFSFIKFNSCVTDLTIVIDRHQCDFLVLYGTVGSRV